MTTAYDTDPNAHTVAAAWASSPLGQPDHEVDDGVTQDAPRSNAKHAVLAFALAGGIGVGAALALTFVDLTPADDVVVVPGSTAPQPAVVVAPSTQAPVPTVVATAPVAAPAIVSPPANVPTSPAATTVVEIPTPAPADEPELNEPLPTSVFPKPLPPGPGDFNQPGPQPPVDFPDLPKAPVPKPDPKPEPPSGIVPDLGLSS